MTDALAPAQIEELSAALRGTVLKRDDAGYEDSRTVWNGMIDRHPAAVARCLGVGDVVACVKFAQKHDVPISVKGGGHNVGGLAVADGALMLDMSPMRGVWVDPGARSAKAQAGCLLGDVDRETQLHGLAAVLGFVSNTGIAGLTLGGGFGYLTRKYGWTCDNLNSIEVVTAEGEVVTASDTQNADLFWALRGGGGNFGVATGFDYKLYPVGPEIVAGAIAWPADQADEVLALYRQLAADGPAELAVIAGLRKAPPAPWIDKSAHGKDIVALFVCHTGKIEQAEKDVAPLKALGKPVGDIVQRRPYVQQQSLIDGTQPKGRRYYWKSEYLKAIDEPLTKKATAQAARIESPHSAVLMFPLAGVLHKLPDDHSPAGNRDAAAVLNVAAAWDPAAEDDKHLAWARDTHAALKEFSTGGVYVNFLAGDEGEDRTRAAYRGNYERLAEAKRKWDPNNVFRINRNIAP